MAHRVYKPALALSPYVQYIWRTENCGVPASRQRVYPDGAMALVIHMERPTVSYVFDGKTYSMSVPLLGGPYSRSFIVDPSEATAVIGILFRPGTAGMFFPVAAHELHNNDVALSELDPGEADRLLNEVCSAAGEEAQLLVIERYLNHKLKGAVPIPPAVRYAVEELSGEGVLRGIRKIQLDTGLSHTRFIQLFREHVGLTPKLFGRVRRFRTVLDRIEKGLRVNWAELAADCGYFDQAHLIHDFRAFAGVTPLEYSRTRPETNGRVFAAAGGS
jgi:AraC-like DNA-binding protein